MCRILRKIRLHQQPSTTDGASDRSGRQGIQRAGSIIKGGGFNSRGSPTAGLGLRVGKARGAGKKPRLAWSGESERLSRHTARHQAGAGKSGSVIAPDAFSARWRGATAVRGGDRLKSRLNI